jgi:hypothetical protein
MRPDISMMDVAIEYLKHLNYLSILVAAAVNFAIGGLWYSPILFGNKWAALNGLKKEDMSHKGSMAALMITAAIVTLFAAFGLAVFTQPFNWKWGMCIGGFIGVFIVVANNIKHYSFLNKPKQVMVIDGFHDIICYAAMGAIMGAWGLK